MADESSKDPIDWTKIYPSKPIKDYREWFKEPKGTPFLGDFNDAVGIREKNDPLRDAVIRLDLDKIPQFRELNSFQIFGAKLALTVIQLAVSYGYIEAQKLKRIADFGAGGGGPTFALAQVAKAVDGEVLAIEEKAHLADEIVASGILPPDKVLIEDGITHLQSVGDSGVGYDLITAFMLGPDIETRLFRNLVRAAARGFNGGVIS